MKLSKQFFLFFFTILLSSSFIKPSSRLKGRKEILKEVKVRFYNLTNIYKNINNINLEIISNLKKSPTYKNPYSFEDKSFYPYSLEYKLHFQNVEKIKKLILEFIFNSSSLLNEYAFFLFQDSHLDWVCKQAIYCLFNQIISNLNFFMDFQFEPDPSFLNVYILFNDSFLIIPCQNFCFGLERLINFFSSRIEAEQAQI